MTDKQTYNKIFKSISIFGSLQAIQMVCKLITVKITSIILGPVGVGWIGMIDNVINLITQGSSFGIQTIGTQVVAKDNDRLNIKKTLFIWMVFCGFLASLFCFLFSDFLSEITFDTLDYSTHFKFLSIYFLLYSTINFSVIILKGLNEIKKLVKFQIISVMLISISTISCYLILGIDGIFPALIVNSIVTFFVYFFYLKKMNLNKIKVSKLDILTEGKYLFSKGSLLALNSVFGLVCFFLIRLYLKNYNPEYLGFYETANLFLVSYFGVIFSSLANDYFPTITNRISKNEDINSYVNIQIQTSILITTPLVLIMYFSYDFIIPLLSSTAFLPVKEILLFGLISIICKAINYPLGYIVLAIGDTKNYFYQNLISDLLILILTIVFFNFFGLIGVGLAMFLLFLFFNFYLLHFISRKKLFFLSSKTLRYLIISFGLSFFMIGCDLTFKNLFFYISKGFLVFIGISYCIFELFKNNSLLLLLKVKGKIKDKLK